MSKFQNDLTSGSVFKNLIIFSWPLMLSMLIQSVYGLTDMIVIGQKCGDVGISAVRNGMQVSQLIMNAVLGFSVGGTALIAQYIGAKKHEDAKKTIGTVLTFFLAAGVLVTVVILFFSERILRAMDTPPVAFSDARDYFDIVMIGTVFIMGYNAISAVLRAMGDSKRPLIFVSIACGINIILNIIFVNLLDMRAAGSALATVIGQGMSFLFSVVYLIKNKFIFEFRLKSFRIYKDKLFQFIKLGLPSSLQQSLVTFSFVFVVGTANKVAEQSGGAILGICGSIEGFAVLPALALSSAITAMAGQCIGAGNIERAKKSMFAGMIMSAVIVIAAMAVIQAFPEFFINLFINEQRSPDFIQQAVSYLRIMMVGASVAMVLVFNFNGLFNGAGYTHYALIATIMSSAVLRIPLARWFAIGMDMNMTGIAYAVMIAPAGSAVMLITLYFMGRWKKPRIIKM